MDRYYGEREIDMRTLLDTPAQLVENGKVCAFGHFKTPFRNLNILDANIRPDSHVWPQTFNRFRLKEWQHVAVIHDELFLGFMLTTTHYLDASFCYVVDRESGKIVEHHRQAPPFVTRVPQELWNGVGGYAVKGYEIGLENTLEMKRHRYRIKIEAEKGLAAIQADLTLHEDLSTGQPLIVVLPIGPNRPLYTHKMVCPAEGTLKLGDRQITFDPMHDVALLDVQKTYYPYNTFWNWATFYGRGASGEALAINLVENIIDDDETYNENTLWVDGAISGLSAVRFTINPTDMLAPWHITTTDGRCDLTFTPQGERAERINMGLILSDYHQPYGTFSGRVVDDAGQEHIVSDAFGVTEHHLARF